MPISFILILGEGLNKKSNVAITGFFISFLIEFFQYILGIGSADIDDLLLNTLGVILGINICFWIKKQTVWAKFKHLLSLPS